ncbi:MAG: hypothetical protein FWE37_01650 [Spirochaetaceae bacterium]|nr:hypothetical protein [Spirochaetaceae bacterium]
MEKFSLNKESKQTLEQAIVATVANVIVIAFLFGLIGMWRPILFSHLSVLNFQGRANLIILENFVNTINMVQSIIVIIFVYNVLYKRWFRFYKEHIRERGK